MTRPTREGLAHAQDCLEELACNPRLEDAFHDLAAMMDMLCWIDPALEEARRESAMGPGAERSPLGGGMARQHTIGRHGLGRPTEDRLTWGAENGTRQRGGPLQPPVEPADQVFQDLRKLRESWHRQLGSWRGQWESEAHSKAGWPR